MKHIAFLSMDFQPRLWDVLYLKDICIIPGLLNKLHGYKTTFLAYETDRPNLDKYFPNCEFVSINKTGNYGNDTLSYLQENSTNIDILYIFSPYPFYSYFLETYKQLNPNGKIYMKMDINRYWLYRLQGFNYFEQFCDLITVECCNIHQTINSTYKSNVELIPNGYYETYKDEENIIFERENTILYVGTFGGTSKNSDILLNGFLSANLPGWKLKIVGNVVETFKPIIDNAIALYPDFNSRVEFVGLITDKKLLDEQYKKAKVFSISSECECFCNVFSEAGKNGCYIVTTNVDGAFDITQNGVHGTIVNINNPPELKLAFENICFNEEKLNLGAKNTEEFVRSELSWEYVIDKLLILFKVNGLIEDDKNLITPINLLPSNETIISELLLVNWDSEIKTPLDFYNILNKASTLANLISLNWDNPSYRSLKVTNQLFRNSLINLINASENNNPLAISKYYSLSNELFTTIKVALSALPTIK